MRNFLRASKIHATNSRKSEKGGFVIIISASSRKAQTSLERKSPSPSMYSHCKSSKSMRPLLLTSRSKMKILPCVRVLASSKFGASVSNKVGSYKFEFLLSTAKDVLISFFRPNNSKFSAKKRVKLLHSGSSQGNKIVLPRKTSGLYSRYAFTSIWMSAY